MIYEVAVFFRSPDGDKAREAFRNPVYGVAHSGFLDEWSLAFPYKITEGLLVTRQGSRAVREGPRNEHTAIGSAPRSSRFQKPEGVASKFASSASLRIATR